MAAVLTGLAFFCDLEGVFVRLGLHLEASTKFSTTRVEGAAQKREDAGVVLQAANTSSQSSVVLGQRADGGRLRNLNISRGLKDGTGESNISVKRDDGVAGNLVVLKSNSAVLLHPFVNPLLHRKCIDMVASASR